MMSYMLDKKMYPEITYGIFGSSILVNKTNLRDLSRHTVIIITDEIIDESLIREFAELILKKGCKNVAFCGTCSEEWKQIFDEVDCEVNGFNSCGEYEDFAVMWCFNDMESLPEELAVCWNEVLILCSNLSLLRQCKGIVDEEYCF